MAALISLIIVLSLSILITRMASVALMHTGLSRDSARFQARSALTGAGFTTAESESVVNHPVRRRIIFWLMIAGNAGFITAISSLILTFIDFNQSQSLILKVLLLAVGIVFLFFLANSNWVDRQISKFVSWLAKRSRFLGIYDYAEILHLEESFVISEIEVKSHLWLANRTLEELQLRDEGVVILGIRYADGRYLGVPNGDALVKENSTLVAYGKAERVRALKKRNKGKHGDAKHEKTAQKQEQEEAQKEQLSEFESSKPPEKAG